MRATLVLFLTLIVFGCDGSQQPQAGRAYFPQRDIDLGEIPVSPDGHVVDVPLRNVGSGLLTITKVATSCGCTSAGEFDTVIPAGSESSIPLRITTVTAGDGGSRVTVSTDGPDDRPQVVELKWTATASVEADPLFVDFGSVRPGSTLERTVLIRTKHAEARVGEWSASPVGRVTVAPSGDSVTIRVETPEELGSYSGMVTAEIEGAWPPELRIPVRWTVRDAYDATPSRLFLGNVAPGQRVERTIAVTSAGGDPLRSVTASVDGIDGLETHVKLDAGSCGVIEVLWRGSMTEGPHAGTIIIEVEGNESRTLRVPVSAFVAVGTTASRSQ